MVVTLFHVTVAVWLLVLLVSMWDCSAENLDGDTRGCTRPDMFLVRLKFRLERQAMKLTGRRQRIERSGSKIKANQLTSQNKLNQH